MTNPELNGLAAIVRASNLHGIAAPPDREDYYSDAAFEKAYAVWEAATLFWRVEVTER